MITFPDVGLPTMAAVREGMAPRERLLGAVSLIDRGWHVNVCDAQWSGWFANSRKKLGRFLELPALRTCGAIAHADIIVIQGRLGMPLLLVAKLLRRKVVYFDVMFDFPATPLARTLHRTAMNMADAIICYSASQAATWSAGLRVDRRKFTTVRYPMDSEFYRRPSDVARQAKCVLSVGRDVGRDFDTLVKAARLIDVNLTLVTLPYLLSKDAEGDPRVTVLHRLPYSELFALYAKAEVVVVPLKANMEYPSGTRAVLEAMLLGSPVVATETAALRENFVHEQDLLFVPPSDPAAMAAAIERVSRDAPLAQRMVASARRKILENFGLNQMVNSFERVLRDIGGPS